MLAAGHSRPAIAARFGVSRKIVDNIAFAERKKARAGALGDPAAAGSRPPAQAVAGGGPAMDVSSLQTAPASVAEAGAFLSVTVPVTRARAAEWGRANGLSGHTLDSLGAINARRRKLGKPPFVVVPSNGTLTRPL